MPIPLELHAANLPDVTPKEMFDYEELMGNVIRQLRNNSFPFTLELRTKRSSGFGVVDHNFLPYAIDRCQKEIIEAGFGVKVNDIEHFISHEYGTVYYKEMTVSKFSKPNLPSA